MDKIFERKYSLELQKLKLGKQEEKFLITGEFFKHFENSPIQEGEVQVLTHITKYNTHLDVTFDFEGYIVLECDRCTEHYQHHFKNSHQVIYTYDEKAELDTDEVILIDRNDPFLVLVPELYDFISLEVPIRKVPLPSVHKCPPEVLALIENIEEEESNDDDDIDPRWEKLKKLKDN